MYVCIMHQYFGVGTSCGSWLGLTISLRGGMSQLRWALVPTWSSSLRESKSSSSSAISVGPFPGLLLLDRAHYHNYITSAIKNTFEKFVAKYGICFTKENNCIQCTFLGSAVTTENDELRIQIF
jgi:hypothetical protein